VLPEVLTGDDVTSDLRSGVYRPKVNSGSIRQRECTSDTPFQPSDFCPQSVAVDALTGSAADAVDDQAASTARATGWSWNSPTPTTPSVKYDEHATSGVADVGGNCRDDRRARRAVFRLETFSNNDTHSVDESRQTHKQQSDQQHPVDAPLFNPDGSSLSNLDAAASSFLRSVSERDVDVQSTSSSLYEVYAQSPGSRRRQQQQRRRHQFDEDVASSRHGAPSPRGASRHSRRSLGRPVSSSFENLVGGLLAVPRSQCRRHLANSTETFAVRNTVLPALGGLCGRGADLPPAMAAFVATGVCITASRGRSSSLPADPVVDPPAEPALPIDAPRRVRRAKRLFNSCPSCVRCGSRMAQL